jgi:hypothetical protein
MTRLRVVTGVDAGAYRRHALHAPEADWPEKNCYIDLWIELLHALRLEPLALLGHTLAVDFAGDQWTFFKPTAYELRDLYGVDVQELTMWRPLVDHALEHLAAGRLVSVEVDAWWLPDTEATDYRRQHTKTTIVFNDIDPQGKRLGYFHNAGYFMLEGEDYEQVVLAPRELPLFAELVGIDRRVQRPAPELAQRSLALLEHHLRWRPRRNPFEAFAPRLAQELAAMGERGMAYYHPWAFASIRQAGSAFELAAAHLDWLARCGHPSGDAASHFRAISAACKSLILKGARVAATGRPFDPRPQAEAMARAWEEGMDAVESRVLQDA